MRHFETQIDQKSSFLAKMLCLKPSVTRRGRRLQSWFLDRLNRESVIFQTTHKTAFRVFTGPSYALILTGPRKVSKNHTKLHGFTIKNRKTWKSRFSWFGPSDKNTRNSPWSTPPELIFVSFGSQESHLSNDPEISVKGVDHFELWIVLGWSPIPTVGDPRARPLVTL